MTFRLQFDKRGDDDGDDDSDACSEDGNVAQVDNSCRSVVCLEHHRRTSHQFTTSRGEPRGRQTDRETRPDD